MRRRRQPPPPATMAAAAEPAEPALRTDRDVVDDFHRLYYDRYREGGTWFDTTWLGRPVWKCPLDLWVYQEILWSLRPDYVVETGTLHGGSAYFLASVMDLLGTGKVVSIDVKDPGGLIGHPRVTYLQGSSTSPEIGDRVREMTADARCVMVILDSDHREFHVRAELDMYAPFVTHGSYLVVEDTNVNGHPALPEFGPGPMEAVESFLASGAPFTPDVRCEKFLMTFNPKGFLRRVG